MKKIIMLLFVIVNVSFAQIQFIDTLNGNNYFQRIGSYFGKTTQNGVAPLPVQIAGQISPGTSLDTVVTVTTTPKRLDSLMSNRADMPIRSIYFQNNTSGATLYIGNDYKAKEVGMVCFYGDVFGDGIGYFRKLSDIKLVGSTTTEVRLKVVY